MKGFEEHIKQTMSNYEMPYNQNDWVRLEQDLDKMNISGRKKKLRKRIRNLTIGGIAVIAVIALIMLVNQGPFSLIHDDSKTGTPEKSEKPQKITINTVDEYINSGTNVAEPIGEKEEKEGEPAGQQTAEKEQNDDGTTTPVEIHPYSIPNSNFIIEEKIVCSPFKIKFIPSEKSDDIIYLWEFGDNTTSTEMCPEHTYTKPGQYDVILTTKYYQSEKISMRKKEKVVKVKASPTAKFEFDNYNNSNTYVFRNRSENTNTMKWIFDKSEEYMNERPTYTYKQGGKHNVTLIASNTNGCSDTLSKDIHVTIKHDVTMPESFEPSGNKEPTFGPEGTNLNEYRFKMTVYDKNDKVIFVSTDVNKRWDGKVLNTSQNATPGQYRYVIVTIDKNGNKNQEEGTVTLK